MNLPSKVKPSILLVDDEERILRTLTMLLKMQYQVFSTTDGHEALKILKKEKINVLISDQRMPLMDRIIKTSQSIIATNHAYFIDGLCRC